MRRSRVGSIVLRGGIQKEEFSWQGYGIIFKLSAVTPQPRRRRAARFETCIFFLPICPKMSATFVK